MKVIVIGAGPAGLMASAQAGKNGAKVLLLDRNEKPGKKLYITGKGRCNVTNDCSPKDFLESVTTNRKFLYSAIFSFSPENTIELIESYGTKLKTERGNRVFPVSDKASDITKALIKHATNFGVEFRSETVLSVSKTGNEFVVKTNDNAYTCDKVIICSGGLSYPTTGSTGDGYEFAKRFGHKIVELRPDLVPILLRDEVKSIEGLSLKNVRATILGESLFGEMLFTANGVSGPIILSLTSVLGAKIKRGVTLSIELKPALDEATLDKRVLADFDKYKNKCVKNSLGDLLPKSLIPFVISRWGVNAERPINSISREERQKLVKIIKNLDFTIDRLDDVHHAIVTGGGVSVNEVNPKTMESKIVSGLYFAGETLDVDALTGGFNIQIALSTGYLAGNSITE
ncbi:MAG: NAD(P)/FAD-dependent oxidoreductase [Clostridia bacterium]|nr:NAD(P)/FAD-dependent oxidoreductase [Clostridia bacterium]